MKNIYISLDELLDTRMGFISNHYPEKLGEILTSDIKHYSNRKDDEDIYKALRLTRNDWYKEWMKRDIDDLKASLLSNIIHIINRIVLDYKTSNEVQIGDDYTVLTINTYPYQLSKEEIDEFSICLKGPLFVVNEMKFVSWDIRKITPTFLTNMFNIIIMYDFHFWSDIHKEDMKKCFAPHKTFIVPKLAYYRPTDARIEELKKDKKYQLLEEMDVFRVVETALSVKLGVHFIHPSNFCNLLHEVEEEEKPINDLDSHPSPFSVYTHDNSQYDPQSQSPQQSVSSEE